MTTQTIDQKNKTTLSHFDFALPYVASVILIVSLVVSGWHFRDVVSPTPTPTDVTLTPTDVTLTPTQTVTPIQTIELISTPHVTITQPTHTPTISPTAGSEFEPNTTPTFTPTPLPPTPTPLPPTPTPLPPTPTSTPPPTPAPTGNITLTFPQNETAIPSSWNNIMLQWKYNDGCNPLPTGYGFEVRGGRDGLQGVMDARNQHEIKCYENTYSYTIGDRSASPMSGTGTFSWDVAVVKIEPYEVIFAPTPNVLHIGAGGGGGGDGGGGGGGGCVGPQC